MVPRCNSLVRPLMRNGPCRWKASRITKAIARHGAVVEVVSATVAQEGPAKARCPSKNWSGRGDMDVRGRRHRPRRGEYPRRGKLKQRCSPPKRSEKAS